MAGQRLAALLGVAGNVDPDVALARLIRRKWGNPPASPPLARVQWGGVIADFLDANQPASVTPGDRYRHRDGRLVVALAEDEANPGLWLMEVEGATQRVGRQNYPLIIRVAPTDLPDLDP